MIFDHYQGFVEHSLTPSFAFRVQFLLMFNAKLTNVSFQVVSILHLTTDLD